MSVMPARTAPRIFSLSPPIGSTRPLSVISPVIATSWRAGRSDSADTIAVAIAMPADGPSFGIAPAGTWMWTSRSNTRLVGDAQPVGVGPRVRPRGARGLLHHVAELAGQDQVALAAHRRGLDEHDVAAGRRVIHAGRDADLILAGRVLGVHARPAEHRARTSARPSTVRSAISFAAIRRATLRASRPSSRSSWRTPASRVYPPMTSRIASSSSASCAGGQRRCRRAARGTRYCARDRELLALGVAGEVDDLHAVEQRRRDVLDEVRGRDEHHLRQVERHAEVVVGERVVLRRVEHLEQRARRIALVRHAELVDLVEQEHRVLASRPASCPAMMRPGSAPTYVRRWPRMSASSRAPPSEMRTYLRPIARAIDFAIDVLPTPGGPANSRMRPRAFGVPARAGAPRGTRARGPSRPEPVVVLVEDLRRAARRRGGRRCACPTAARRPSRGRCGSPATPSTRGRSRSSRRHSRSTSLRASSGSGSLSSFASSSSSASSCASSPSPSSFWIAFICSRRYTSLLALAELLLDLRLDVLLRVEHLDLALDVDQHARAAGLRPRASRAAPGARPSGRRGSPATRSASRPGSGDLREHLLRPPPRARRASPRAPRRARAPRGAAPRTPGPSASSGGSSTAGATVATR